MKTVIRRKPTSTFWVIKLTILTSSVVLKIPFGQGQISNSPPTDLWEYGFLIDSLDDGTQRCNGRVPPTYFLDIPAGNWYAYTAINLKNLTPPPVLIERVAVGGEGWDFEGFWDRLSLMGDGTELLVDGDFAQGFTFWDTTGSGIGDLTWQMDSLPGRSHVFHYRITNAFSDGGNVLVYQDINVTVDSFTNLIFSGEVLLLDHTLTNPGWWCCINGCAPEHGEYAAEVRINYQSSVGIKESYSHPLPIQFQIDQNHLNPFHSSTLIRYTLSGVRGRGSGDSGQGKIPVRLEVNDLTGRLVETLVDEHQKPGVYQVPITSHQLPGSGIYFYRLKAGDFTATRKMILLR